LEVLRTASRRRGRPAATGTVVMLVPTGTGDDAARDVEIDAHASYPVRLKPSTGALSVHHYVSDLWIAAGVGDGEHVFAPVSKVPRFDFEVRKQQRRGREDAYVARIVVVCRRRLRLFSGEELEGCAQQEPGYHRSQMHDPASAYAITP
jgi:hypothetical protein